MALGAWGSDYPAASNFITGWFTCDAALTPSAGFCDPRIDAMIERATQMQLDDPAEAGALWAEIDREIVDQAPYVWLVNLIAESSSSPSEWATTSTASNGAAPCLICCGFGKSRLSASSTIP